MVSNKILTLNGGSSSIRFAFFDATEPYQRRVYGKIERIGIEGTKFTFSSDKKTEGISESIAANDFQTAIDFLITWLKTQPCFDLVEGIGHRIVHGMRHTQPELITQRLLDELRGISPYDPDHLPAEIALIEALRKSFPSIPQVACFDTAFHGNMPRVAKLLPIPRSFDTMGVQRYGFHGISYEYLMEELNRTAGKDVANGKVILAHLGNGASLAAVQNAQSIDTSMGFTPAGGVLMGTRSGDMDPGVAWYIMQKENRSPMQFNDLINHRSGLLGVSETSSDMEDLLKQENKDVRSAEAIALFCYQVKKCIGAYAAVLGGLDTLVFAGGIGEHAPVIRQRICAGLEYLGIKIDEKQNEANAGVISSDNSKVSVRVISTHEEWIIARAVCAVINKK